MPLRRALADDPKDPKFIETIPGRGYHLLAEITDHTSSKKDVQEAVPWFRRKGRHSVWLAASAVLALLAVASGLYVYRQAHRPVTKEPIDSIAVLPFVNVEGDPENDYLCDGIPRSISAGLSRLTGLRVIPSSELDRYRGQVVGAEAVARELGVRTVLAGKLLHRGNDAVVSVELIDAVTNRLLWGAQFNRPFSDTLEVQQVIAGEVGAALRPQLSDREHGQLTRRDTENPEAYKACLRGRYQAERLTGDHVERSRTVIQSYEEAIKLDPGFALAHVALGNTYWQLASFGGSEKDCRKAREALERALEMDPALPSALQLKAWILWSWEKEWAKAGAEYRKSMELDPGVIFTAYPRHEVLYLLWLGRCEEAQKIMKKRLATRLNLHSWGWTLLYSRDFKGAAAVGEQLLELEPKSAPARWLLLYAYDALGMYDDAFEADRSAVELSSRTELATERLERAYRESGMSGVWRLSIENQFESGQVRPIDLALRYARVGDRDKAFDWLEKGIELPLEAPVTTHPLADPLRNDPRFERFLRKIKLPEDAIRRALAY